MILPRAELTPSGRPKLLVGEVERVLLDKVDVEFEGTGCTEGCAVESVYKAGYCVVTSHRLLWIDAAAAATAQAAAQAAAGRSCALPLESIAGVHKRVQYGLNVMNPKVRLEVKLFVDRHFRATHMQGSATFKHLHLRCRGEAPDSFQEHLHAALAAHRQQLEQQQQRQRQQQQQQQQQQQHAAPWAVAAAASSGPVSHPISGAAGASLSSGSFSQHGAGGPTPMWIDSPSHSYSQQQQQGGGAAASGGGRGLRSPAAAASQRGLQAVDRELLGQLVDMGFPRARVVRALLATHNEDAQAALDWILAAGGDPAMDAPLPVPEPAVVTKHELQRLLQLNMLQGQQQQQMGPPAAAGFRSSQEQLLNPGWGMGSVSAAAAIGGGAAAAAGGAHQHPGGSWSAVGPLTAGLGAGGGGSRSGSPTKQLRASGLSAASPTGAAGSSGGGMNNNNNNSGSGPSSRVVGVAGIMHREAEKTSQTAANLAAAFQDLDNLMGMAADMVKLAEKFRGVMGPDGAIIAASAAQQQQQQPSSGGGSGGSFVAAGDAAGGAASGPSGSSGSSGSELLLDSETQLQLIAMGITSPVTRASAGARYQQELARQLADFLSGPLARAGGVMMLPDVYCLFNRARGTELVSPDDLLQACDAFAQIGLPLRLRKFPSGVTVVQGSQFSDAQLCRNIEQLLQRKSQLAGGAAAGAAAADTFVGASSSSVVSGLGPALSAADVSTALLLPLTLAKEALLVAESAGVLCRDDGPEGLRFFSNLFREATWPLQQAV